MTIMDNAAVELNARRLKDYEMILNLANLVASKEMVWTIAVPKDRSLLMNNLIVRAMEPLFERAAIGLEDHSAFGDYGVFFKEHAGADRGPFLVTAMSAFLKGYIVRCKEAKVALPFEFAPLEQREEVAALLYALAEKMRECGLVLPRWPPPRTRPCF